ncbi:sterol desaturase family protein [Sandarakinorhabdus sp.]|uniref:sterol desaturase family protein n=1 Tax=Sandarakinorhabdus sp. TaxID=1916663 RepID=UPI00286DD944|nr:sterol desaturase family protein [Sandarakinorhabdus sp.]
MKVLTSIAAVTRSGLADMKKTLLDLLPPAMVASVLTFWAYAPATWTKPSWSITVAAWVTMALIQALELVAERHPGWRINWRELLTDMFYVGLSATAISWAAATFADDPVRAAKDALGIATPGIKDWPFLIQVGAVLVLFEFGQYWMHRLMHNNALLWSTHAPHHHVTQLNAMKGAVGNPIEMFLINLSILALFDFPQTALFAAFNVMTVVVAFAHANVRSDPPIWYGYFFTTIRHHSLHHTALSYEDTRWNYGNALILFDRIFGTYREGESAIVGQDERKRLSIGEQFMFPFRPLVAKFKAKRAASSGL